MSDTRQRLYHKCEQKQARVVGEAFVYVCKAWKSSVSNAFLILSLGHREDFECEGDDRPHRKVQRLWLCEL